MHTADATRIGAYGAHIISTAVASTGMWMAIFFMSATVFATLTELGVTRVGSIASCIFPAGSTIYGGFTNLTLTSGSVRCYAAQTTRV
jgi:hypothetical protein